MSKKFDHSVFTIDSGVVRRHGGFSFAEVMFATVILGIGFIMVAAIFPVAIRQTQSTGEENNAAAAARAAAAAIMSLPSTLPNPYRSIYTTTPYSGLTLPATVSVFPPTIKNYVLGSGSGLSLVPLQSVVPPAAVVVPFVGIRGSMLQANVIQSTDPHYSYVAFYKRENNSSVAELIVVAVANRNRSSYDATDLPNANSQSLVTASIAPTPGTPTAGMYTTIYPESITIQGTPNGLTEGCTLGYYGPYPPNAPFPAAIRSFTAGRPLTASQPPTVFELNPGDGVTVAPSNLSGLWGDISSTASPYADPRIKDGDLPAAGMANASMVFNKVTTLQPTVAYVQKINATANNPSGQITISAGQIFDQQNHAPALAAVTGAFVIIADDCPYAFDGSDGEGTAPSYTIPPNTAKFQVGKLNGRIFRLGAQVLQDTNGNALSGVFQLDPAYGMQPGVADASVPGQDVGSIFGPDSFPNPYTPKVGGGVAPPPMPARCYIIGAGKDASGNVSGTAQDLGVFATYFQVQ